MSCSRRIIASYLKQCCATHTHTQVAPLLGYRSLHSGVIRLMPVGNQGGGKSDLEKGVQADNRFGQKQQGDRGETQPTAADANKKDKLAGRDPKESEGTGRDAAPEGTENKK